MTTAARKSFTSFQFFNWIIQNSQFLNLKTYRRSKVGHYIPGIIDLVITSKNKQIRNWHGQGWGHSQYEASIKGIAEILEREIMDRHEISNSNGCSVHIDFKSARDNAFYELIERDAFFCHYLTSTPFDSFNEEAFVFGETVKSLTKRLKSHGLEFKIYKMRPAVKCHAIFVYMAHKSGKEGFQFGTACSDDLPRAIEHAAIEALRSIVHNEQSGQRALINENNFLTSKAKNLPMIRRHGLLRRNLAYARYFKKTFLVKTKVNSKIGKAFLQKKSIKFVTYSTQFKDFENLPLIFVKAHSSKLQNLYFGANDLSIINLPRLAKFLNIKEVKSVNHRFHPFS